MSRARATEPVTDSTEDRPEIVGLKSLVLFRGADGQDRPAIITRLTEDGVNAVVFGHSHDDSEAGLKVGLVRKGDHWAAG